MRTLFTLAIFLSAFLLFMVEPLAAKMILPTFGGTPQVWNASMVFFQISLLAGYAYAHWLGGRGSKKTQWGVHGLVLLLACVVLPMSTHTGWFGWVRQQVAGTTSPTLLVLFALAGLVGLPFFALSANSSLLQKWFGNAAPNAGEPYFLYAASNAGSVLALLAYPFVIEPQLKLSQQALWWTAGYAALIAAILTCGYLQVRTKEVEQHSEESEAVVLEVTLRDRLQWVALSAVPSSLLLGVTTYLTSNIAPVPLLWVLPLTLYLVTFILVFARKPKTPVVFLSRALPLLVTPLALTMILESTNPIRELATLHLVVFFCATWMCHSRLSLARPHPKHLTEYYLWISVGGVVGGCFNSLLAPVLFNTLVEYPLGIVAACLLRVPIQPKRVFTPKWANPRGDALVAVAISFVTLALVLGAKIGPTLMAGHPVPEMAAGWQRTLLLMGVPVILCFITLDRPLRFGLSLLGVFVVSITLHSSASGMIALTERSFFGVHRVTLTSNGQWHSLVHGNTLHGMQNMRDPSVPLTYYHTESPIGQIMRQEPKDRVALVGLGVGSLSAYGRPGQSMTFYEIDPLVKKIATDRKYFTYTSDSKANISFVMGDARLTMAKSTDTYGLIVLDAFSSDAIPVHLLTEEAIQMYLKHLEPGGLLAFHISNRYLRLQPVIQAAAIDLGLVVRYQEDGITPDEEKQGKRASNWVLVSRSDEDLGKLAKSVYWDKPDPEPNIKAWTDDFSNVLSVFKSSGD